MGEQGFSLFHSYAHEDAALRDELAKHLRAMERRRVIRAWHDREITAGAEWQGEIDRHLRTADVVLLLISPDFMASDYCYDIELAESLRRHALGECVVIPVILRPVAMDGAPFMASQALPTGGGPVVLRKDRDSAFADVAVGIRHAVTRLAEARERPTEGADAAASLEKRSRDVERLRGYRDLLDRPAFNMPCIFEDSLEAVSLACDEISLAMLTGKVRLRSWEGDLYEVAKRSEFETEQFVTSLEQIRNYLAAIKCAVSHVRGHLAAPDKAPRRFGRNRQPGVEQGKVWHMEFRASGLAELPPITSSSQLIELSRHLGEYDWDNFYLRTHAELRAFLSEDD